MLTERWLYKCWVLGLYHHPNHHSILNTIANVYCIQILDLPSNGEISGILECQSVLFSSLDPRLRPRHLKDFVFANHQKVVVGKMGFPIFKVPTSLNLIPSLKCACLFEGLFLLFLTQLQHTLRGFDKQIHKEYCWHVSCWAIILHNSVFWCLEQLFASFRGRVKPTRVVRPAQWSVQCIKLGCCRIA